MRHLKTVSVHKWDFYGIYKYDNYINMDCLLSLFSPQQSHILHNVIDRNYQRNYIFLLKLYFLTDRSCPLTVLTLAKPYAAVGRAQHFQILAFHMFCLEPDLQYISAQVTRHII